MIVLVSKNGKIYGYSFGKSEARQRALLNCLLEEKTAGRIDEFVMIEEIFK